MIVPAKVLEAGTETTTFQDLENLKDDRSDVHKTVADSKNVGIADKQLVLQALAKAVND